MSTWLNDYLEQPGTTEPWLDAGDRTLYCVLDQVRHPNALASLYQLPTAVDIVRLFQGTPFAELYEVSPLWVRVDAESAAAAELAELCRSNRSGILLTSRADPESAVGHARRLLRMHSEAHGDALARFYDPAFWCALALTVSANTLHGPWERVYTPPATPSDPTWRIWSRVDEVEESSSEGGYPLRLEDSTLAAADDMRWWYWVRGREAETVGQLPNERLPLVFDNLRLLVEHGIEEGRQLERLLPHLTQQPLRDHAERMQVLRSELPAFEKVQRLEV